MFSTEGWFEKGTIFKSLGIIIAPEIFTMHQRAHLSNGRIVLADTQYFTWPTAKALTSEGYMPDGWRMPTFEEASIIQAHYNRQGMGLLTLGLNGYICPNDMIAYNYIPTNGDNFIVYKGKVGYYWIDSLDKPLYAHVITNTGINVQVGGSIIFNYGIPLLLVKSL